MRGVRRTLEEWLELWVPEPNTGCWLWLGPTCTRGYAYCSLTTCGTLRANRFLWSHRNGPIPPGMVICHRCDTPTCVNPDHLFLGTSADNSHDMLRKGRGKMQREARLRAELGFIPEKHQTGERHPNAKLTDEQVLAIRAYKGTHRETARAFGISRPHAQGIRLGRRRVLLCRKEAKP